MYAKGKLSVAENQDQSAGKRAAVYIDGFNLYHPVHELGENWLKWADLWRMGLIMCSRHGCELVSVTFCTAVPQDDPGKRDRHNAFNAAQRAKGVKVILGHHVIDPSTGKRSEKCSDINVALSVILDAEDNKYDCAYLLSADSDQGATARFFRERFPNKRLYGVAPPTKDVPQKVKDHADGSFVISKLDLETCNMPMYVQGKTGHPIRRPFPYDPPEWWVHPDNRPRKTKG